MDFGHCKNGVLFKGRLIFHSRLRLGERKFGTWGRNDFGETYSGTVMEKQSFTGVSWKFHATLVTLCHVVGFLIKLLTKKKKQYRHQF